MFDGGSPTDTPADLGTTGDAPDVFDGSASPADASPDVFDGSASPADASPDVFDGSASPADAPSSAADAPSSAADAPSSAADAPSSAADAPPSVTDAPPTVTDVPITLDDAGFGPWTPIPGGERCNARERRAPLQTASHVEPDAGPIAWITNPPSSGPHFGNWARFGAFANIPRGNWVHNLEHGGVAFLYRCAADAGTCATARDALIAAAETIPGDPACTPDAGSPRLRVVITNDAEIESPIAGAAWGWLYTADCVEPASVRSFFTRHVGMAPEDVCFDGSVP